MIQFIGDAIAVTVITGITSTVTVKVLLPRIGSRRAIIYSIGDAIFITVRHTDLRDTTHLCLTTITTGTATAVSATGFLLTIRELRIYRLAVLFIKPAVIVIIRVYTIRKPVTIGIQLFFINYTVTVVVLAVTTYLFKLISEDQRVISGKCSGA